VKLDKTLERCLADLEECIDPVEEDRLIKDWIDFSYGRCSQPLFEPQRRQTRKSGLVWPVVSINAALQDYDQMALQQYGACSNALASASGLLMNVRCNYGTAIMPSLFGASLFVMDEALETLPTSWPLGGVDAIKRLLDSPLPELWAGLGGQVLRMGERYAEIGRSFPKIGQYVFIYHPDLQGPVDICELLWGSTIFFALVDRPDLVHLLLERVTQTYIRFMRQWSEIVPFQNPGNAHWGFYHLGNLMLRDDSAMNLSPAMVREFVLPYDQLLLDEFGGGAIHFCGKGDHFITSMSGLRGLYAINCSQPELNSMEKIYQKTVDLGINLLGLRHQAAISALDAGRDLYGRVHVVT
jgi:hypothetical protein